jgi:hypothetical protein
VSAVDRLFGDYVSEHRAGGAADPRDYLARAPEDERDELAALIDAYLARAPRRRFDATAFRGSSAERIVGDLERALGGRSGLWPAMLPELRHRAGLKRSELVFRLADALGVPGREARVGDYYHQMEQGLLPASGVSERVLAALGEIVGESVESLRAAGKALSPFASSGPAAGAQAFARRAEGESPAEPVAAAAAARTSAPEPDEVDRLFRGG